MSWRRPWLFQHLRAPGLDPEASRRVGLAFGAFGATVNGGLSPEALDILRPVFDFAPMGDAEYEWGAVPVALGRIAEGAAEYVRFVVSTTPREAAPTWEVALELRRKRTERSRLAVLDRHPRLDLVAFARGEHAAQAEAAIRGLVAGTLEAKDRTGLDRHAFPSGGRPAGPVGWLNLENAFAFFADHAMAGRFARAFGLSERCGLLG